MGSVLVLQGNGADVAKHCVPAVRGERISITFRKIDQARMQMEAYRGLDGSDGNGGPVRRQLYSGR